MRKSCERKIYRFTSIPRHLYYYETDDDKFYLREDYRKELEPLKYKKVKVTGRLSDYKYKNGLLYILIKNPNITNKNNTISLDHIWIVVKPTELREIKEIKDQKVFINGLVNFYFTGNKKFGNIGIRAFSLEIGET